MSRKQKGPAAAATASAAQSVKLGRPTQQSYPQSCKGASEIDRPLADNLAKPDHLSIAYRYEKRGGTIEMIAGVRSYMGRKHFDMREWIGGRQPTVKGISIPLEHVRSIAEAMLALCDEQDR